MIEALIALVALALGFYLGRLPKDENITLPRFKKAASFRVRYEDEPEREPTAEERLEQFKGGPRQ